MSNKSIVESLEKSTQEIRVITQKYLKGEIKAMEVAQVAKIHNSNASQIMAHIKAQEINVRYGLDFQPIKLS
jgi:hypothetical protein